VRSVSAERSQSDAATAEAAAAGRVIPDPVIPDYGGANLCGIMPALLGPGGWATSLPDWMPAAVGDARQAVVFVLDGLGWDQLQEHANLLPTLTSMSARRITSVAPTTTATALTSITTGLTPSEHGLIGYRMMMAGDVVNVLRWSTSAGDVRRIHPPRDVQGFTPFLGAEVPVVSPFELQSSAFSEAHLRGSRPVGWRSASAIAVEIGVQLRAGERLVYAYYGGVDKTAHERGFGPYYDAELRTADRLVGDVIEALVPGSVLLVTADHGQVQVGGNIVQLDERLLALVANQSGEGRFRWLHAKPGAAAELLATARALYGDLAWVVSREQTIDEHWFGRSMPAPVGQRLGDVALVAHAPVSFDDPLDTGPFELVCRHGSLTSAEVYVPLLATSR
jgi:predicted AlkP superfamily pyrophosphatase or phosphodiesterase